MSEALQGGPDENGTAHQSLYFVVLAVVGCLAMFAAVTVYAAIAVGNAIVQFYGAGATLDGIATVTVYAFKILDLFLIGTILYIVALGLAALFLDSEAALRRSLARWPTRCAATTAARSSPAGDRP